MILLPFLGVFLTLTLWGTFFRVPGFIDPAAPFQLRLAGAVHGTTMASALYELVDTLRLDGDALSLGPLASCRRPLDSVEPDFALFPAGTVLFNTSATAPTSSDFRLHQHLLFSREEASPLPHGPRAAEQQQAMSPAAGGEREHGRGHAAGGLALVMVLVTIAYALGVLRGKKAVLLSSASSASGVRRSTPGQVPVLRRCQSLYEAMDLLLIGGVPWLELRFPGNGGNGNGDGTVRTPFDTSTGSALVAAPSSQTGQSAQQKVSILRQVEKAISRAELQRVYGVAVSARSDRIVTEAVTDSDAVVGAVPGKPADLDLDLRRAREWALVVRRPENDTSCVTYLVVNALLAVSARQTAAAVPVVSPSTSSFSSSAQAPVEITPGPLIVSSSPPAAAVSSSPSPPSPPPASPSEAEPVKLRGKRHRPSKNQRVRLRRRQEEEAPQQAAQFYAPMSVPVPAPTQGYGYGPGPAMAPSWGYGWHPQPQQQQEWEWQQYPHHGYY